MKPSVKKTWIEALRSKRYKQGRGTMCDAKERWCCLGVLVDAAVDGEWRREAEAQPWEFFENRRQDEPLREAPDQTLRTKLGLTIEDVSELVKMNDEEMRDFSSIARWIDEHL